MFLLVMFSVDLFQTNANVAKISGGIWVAKIYSLGLNDFNSHYITFDRHSCLLGLTRACSAIVRESLYGSQLKLTEIKLPYSAALYVNTAEH